MFENAGRYRLPELMEQFVRIPSFTFLTLLALEYRIPPCRVKHIFPSVPLNSPMESISLLTTSTSKLPQKKNLPFCFVVNVTV